ncbi:hypothetical protein AC230_11140 [Streptomyces caatingaensis]|uniref:Uncharacterized protein n=1 Tax=Streptomyces caatingaensis TaxID=1678637 RepID=A0A0K9XGE8_9ACTN|nr:hypothetical protein AC230_11140 [Streptomyces caatingaensis]
MHVWQRRVATRAVLPAVARTGWLEEILDHVPAATVVQPHLGALISLSDRCVQPGMWAYWVGEIRMVFGFQFPQWGWEAILRCGGCGAHAQPAPMIRSQ